MSDNLSLSERRLRVLVVDDDPLVLLGTSAMIEDLGHEPVEARSGSQALSTAQNERIDVVLTDLTMPGMSGLELATSLRAIDPALPVVIVTGHSEEVGGRADLPRLSKPFTLAALAGALSAATQR
jgi:CheY-like chemotaxis protein